MTLIAPFQSGLVADIEPWLAPADSFSKFNNMHIHHGYVEKRQGYRLFGALAAIAAGAAIINITQANPGEVTSAAPHLLTTGDMVYLVSVGGMTSVNNKIFTITVIDATHFTIDLNTTSLSPYTVGGTFAKVDPITDRVMGIDRHIDATGIKTTLAFNARRAYSYNVGTSIFDQLDGVDIFTSGEYDYVWTANWQSSGGNNRLYFTNGLPGVLQLAPPPPPPVFVTDGIRYFDPSVSLVNTFEFSPKLDSVALWPYRVLTGAKLIFTLGQRLLCLNTYEYEPASGVSVNYPQRVRWCAKQDPGNWNDSIAGGGGYADAATGDHIISARALQNQIIVFFTNSVWTLTTTPDPAKPLRWQKINSFRACDGKMASVAYDRYAVALGTRGITATDGVETRRVDEKISKFTVDDINVNEFQKVFCERSYSNRRMWSLFNAIETASGAENDSALIYDDDSSSFSTYSINMNCLGYGNFSKDFALDDFTAATSMDFSLNDFNDEDLFSFFWQENQETLLGGDIYGNVMTMEAGNDDNGVIIEGEFISAAWNPFKEEGAECRLNFVDLFISTDVATKATISFYKDTQRTPYCSQEIDLLPDLDYVAEIIDATQTNPVVVNAPSHGRTSGDIIYIYGSQGMIQINSGEAAPSYTVTVIDENNFSLNGINGTTFNAYTTGGKVYLREFYRTKTYKRAYGGGIGFQHRIQLMTEGLDCPLIVHGIRPNFIKRGKRSIS